MSKSAKLVLSASLGALGFVLYYVHFALIVFPSYLTYDPADLPALVGALAAGPAVGVAAELVKNALYLLLGAGEPVGVSANALAGSVYVVVVWLLARGRPGRRLALAMGVATVATAAVMTVTNAYVWLPAYGVAREEAAALLLPAILPFNLVKFAITSAVGYPLYLAARPALASVLARAGDRAA